MKVPRFSLRSLFFITTVASVCFATFKLAPFLAIALLCAILMISCFHILETTNGLLFKVLCALVAIFALSLFFLFVGIWMANLQRG